MYTSKQGDNAGLLMSIMDSIRGDVQMKLPDTCSFMHVKALDFIATEKTPSMSDVAAFLKITSPGATLVVDRLVENGELDRIPDPDDRRVVRLSITTKGRETLVKGMKIVKNILDERIAVLTKVEQKSLGTILAKLIKKSIN